VAFLLAAALCVETLPLGFVEPASFHPGDRRERTVSIEPLQLCDHGDAFLGVLSDLPVLLPGALCLFPSVEARSLGQPTVQLAPDGYPPVMDHPPRRSA
jgi:hypothetical protein